MQRKQYLHCFLSIPVTVWCLPLDIFFCTSINTCIRVAYPLDTMLYTLSCDFGNLPYVLFLTLSFWSHIVFLAGLLSAWNVGEGGLPSPQHLLTSLQGSTTGRLSKMLLSRRRLMCSLLGLWVGVPHVIWWCDVWSSEGLLLECMNPIQERRDAFQLIPLEQKRCHSQDPWFLLSILAICPSQWYLFSKITCILHLT